MYKYYKLKRLIILWNFEIKYFCIVFRKKRIICISMKEGFSIGFFDRTY